MSNQRVLITGGSGFIGSHIAELWLARGASVRVLDNLRTGHRRNLAGLDIDFREASILDPAALASAVEGVDYIFHLAAMVSVPESMEDPIACVELNATGALRVLEAAAAAGVKKVVLSSSAAVYGDNPTVPKREDMLPEPKSPYAVTKLDGEYYLKMFAETGRVATTSLRYFNVFGPRQDPGSAYAAAVPIFIHRALRHEPILVHGDGGQTRDFVSVKDIARANAFVAESTTTEGSYNVGYGRSISILELAQLIVKLTNSKSEIIHGPARAGDVRHSMASADRLAAAGFRAEANFEGALAETIEYFRHVGK